MTYIVTFIKTFSVTLNNIFKAIYILFFKNNNGTQIILNLIKVVSRNASSEVTLENFQLNGGDTSIACTLDIGVQKKLTTDGLTWINLLLGVDIEMPKRGHKIDNL